MKLLAIFDHRAKMYVLHNKEFIPNANEFSVCPSSRIRRSRLLWATDEVKSIKRESITERERRKWMHLNNREHHIHLFQRKLFLTALNMPVVIPRLPSQGLL